MLILCRQSDESTRALLSAPGSCVHRFQLSFLDDFLTTLSSTGWLAISSTCSCWATSTRAACPVAQCPETSAQRDNADTYATLESQPMTSETGIIAIQKIVKPQTRHGRTG